MKILLISEEKYFFRKSEFYNRSYRSFRLDLAIWKKQMNLQISFFYFGTLFITYIDFEGFLILKILEIDFGLFAVVWTQFGRSQVVSS